MSGRARIIDGDLSDQQSLPDLAGPGSSIQPRTRTRFFINVTGEVNLKRSDSRPS